MMHTRLLGALVGCAAATLALAQAPAEPAKAPAKVEAKAETAKPEAKAADPKAVSLVLEDQFSHRCELAGYKGDVVVLVYGDRRATDECRALGEKLHTLFHPAAAGETPAKARTAPVVALPGVGGGVRSPDVSFVPVAVVGNVPALVRDLIRTQVKKASPDVPVWLDFTGVMEKDYTLRAGQANLVVFDGASRLRLKVNGTPDEPTMATLLQTIQNLRAEAAGIAAAGK